MLGASRPAAILLLAILAHGCSGRPERAAAPRSVLLISIDTLRPDMLGCYGHGQPTSPNLDRLAAGGTVFETALATAPWTLPSHGSLLTGLYPGRHGLKAEDRRLPEEVTTLAEVLSRQGFATGGFVNSFWLSRRFGFDRGFDDFLTRPPGTGQRPPGGVIKEAVAWLAGVGDGPFFLLVHDYHVHSDYLSLPLFENLFVRAYDGPIDGSTRQLMDFRRGRLELAERDVEHLKSLYAAGIRQTDARIGRLLAALEQTGRLDETLVIVTSDHGEEFLEHGGVLHGRTHYDELLRVPLILRGPGVPAGRRLTVPVSLVDVQPTILALLGITPPPDLDGVDLTPAWSAERSPAGNGKADLSRRYLLAEADHHNEEPDILRSVRYRNLKLIYNRRTKKKLLFDLDHDPGERHNLAADQPERVDLLLARLAGLGDRRAAAAETLPELDPEEVERLRALGYLQP